jgi:hypothetical protein
LGSEKDKQEFNWKHEKEDNNNNKRYALKD